MLYVSNIKLIKHHKMCEIDHYIQEVLKWKQTTIQKEKTKSG